MGIEKPRTMTTGQVLERLGISRTTWFRWLKAGDAPRALDRPGRPVWLESEIEQLALGAYGRRHLTAHLRARASGGSVHQQPVSVFAHSSRG